jgi:hypothetical protein
MVADDRVRGRCSSVGMARLYSPQLYIQYEYPYKVLRSYPGRSFSCSARFREILRLHYGPRITAARRASYILKALVPRLLPWTRSDSECKISERFSLGCTLSGYPWTVTSIAILDRDLTSDSSLDTHHHSKGVLEMPSAKTPPPHPGISDQPPRWRAAWHPRPYILAQENLLPDPAIVSAGAAWPVSPLLMDLVDGNCARLGLLGEQAAAG